MSISSDIANILKQERSIFGSVTIRHEGNEYQSPAKPLSSALNAGAMALVAGATGVSRLLVSELKEPLPKSEDTIQVQELTCEKEFHEYTILDTSYDHTGVTMLIQYGETYGT
jgi:Cdc6-like AAA superfamily ATPase